jgi:WD40 repeat protein
MLRIDVFLAHFTFTLSAVMQIRPHFPPFDNTITVWTFHQRSTNRTLLSYILFVAIKTLLTLKHTITINTGNPRNNRTIWKTTTLTCIGTHMIHCFIIRLFTGVTVLFSGEKSRHACDYIIMIIMQKQINLFFLVRSGKNNSILMFFRNNINQIIERFVPVPPWGIST